MGTGTTETATGKRAGADGTSRTRKDAVVDFLRAAATGHAREAFARHAAPAFRHHNPFFRGDAKSLWEAMDENAAKFPDKALEVRHLLADGDYVVAHSSVHMHPGGAGHAVVHLFRFEGDKVAELWDVGQQIPAGSPNENGAF